MQVPKKVKQDLSMAFYYEALPVHRQEIFFRTLIYPSDAIDLWENKWEGISKLLKQGDNVAFLFIAMEETLRWGRSEIWFPLAIAVREKYATLTNSESYSTYDFYRFGEDECRVFAIEENLRFQQNWKGYGNPRAGYYPIAITSAASFMHWLMRYFILVMETVEPVFKSVFVHFPIPLYNSDHTLLMESACINK